MAFNEFKALWSQYDHKLTENLRLNERLLRNTNLNAFRRELQKPLLYEQANTTVMLILIPVFILISLQYTDNIKFLISGLIFCLALTVNFLLGLRKLKQFHAIDYYHTPLIRLQEQLTRLQVTILRSRRLELMLIPFLIIPGVILLMKMMHDIDVLVYTQMLWRYATAGVAGTFAATILINKYLYDRKIRNLENILKELKNYQTTNE